MKKKRLMNFEDQIIELAIPNMYIQNELAQTFWINYIWIFPIKHSSISKWLYKQHKLVDQLNQFNPHVYTLFWPNSNVEEHYIHLYIDVNNWINN